MGDLARFEMDVQLFFALETRSLFRLLARRMRAEKLLSARSAMLFTMMAFQGIGSIECPVTNGTRVMSVAVSLGLISSCSFLEIELNNLGGTTRGAESAEALSVT